MTQDNSPENNGLTKEFHSCFSEDLKKSYERNSILKQAVSKYIEKK